MFVCVCVCVCVSECVCESVCAFTASPGYHVLSPAPRFIMRLIQRQTPAVCVRYSEKKLSAFDSHPNTQ